MGAVMTDQPSDADRLPPSVRSGDRAALEVLFGECRERLRRMVQFRLDRRLQSRIDPSDVLQEAFLEASRRMQERNALPDMSGLLWLRLLVGEKLLKLHRHHLGTAKRNAALELSLYTGPLPAASSAALAAQLVGNITSPSQVAQRAERMLQVQEALGRMDEIDREVLALRHFEHLSNAEAARTLGIDESAASNRYVRALKRLKKVIDETMT
jgi:RNA polymerase sigma-70 factor (ECF subfamily)